VDEEEVEEEGVEEMQRVGPEGGAVGDTEEAKVWTASSSMRACRRAMPSRQASWKSVPATIIEHQRQQSTNMKKK
jgi:hypothetical protein